MLSYEPTDVMGESILSMDDLDRSNSSMLSNEVVDTIDAMERSYSLFTGASPNKLRARFNAVADEFVGEEDVSENSAFSALTHVWLDAMSELETYGIRTTHAPEGAWEAFEEFRKATMSADEFTDDMFVLGRNVHAIRVP